MSARPSLSVFWALHGLARSSHLLPAHPPSAVGWQRQSRREILKEGFPVYPLVSFSFFPVHDLSFPSWWDLGKEAPQVVLPAEGLSDGAWLLLPRANWGERDHERPSYIFTWHKLSDAKNELLPCIYAMPSCWIVLCLKYVFLSVEHF